MEAVAPAAVIVLMAIASILTLLLAPFGWVVAAAIVCGPALIVLGLAALPTSLLEAWFRLRLGKPYRPPLTSPFHPDYEPPPVPEARAAPPPRSGPGWLIGLAVGLWLGGFFGDD
jgi:hypothetical protein